MLPKIREAINEATVDLLQRENLNWTTIQRIDFMKKYNCEFSSRTLYRIKQGYTPKIKTTIKILEYFKIPHAENYGIINLIKSHSDEV